MNNSWQENKRQLFRFRIRQLYKWDSLVSKDGSWHVNCLPDDNGSVVYIVMQNGEEVVRRKRIESAIDFLIAHEAPEDLSFVEDGAVGEMTLAKAKITGYNRIVKDADRIAVLSATHLTRHTKSASPNYLVTRAAHRVYHEVIRLVVGRKDIDDNDDTWTPTTLRSRFA